VRVATLARVEAQTCLGADGSEGAEGLIEDLLTVGHEEDPAVLRAVRVEGAEPGFPETGGQHHQAGGIACRAGSCEGGEGLLLDSVGCWDLPRLGWDLYWRPCGPLESVRWRTAGPVALDPVGGQLLRGGMGEQAFEGLHHPRQGVALGR
jgi:hypothetical protein